MSLSVREQHQLESKLSNRLWRLNNIYTVVTDEGEKVRFQLLRVQYILYKGMWWRVIVLKSRQHGVTTFFALLGLDMCLFNSNISAGLVAHKDKDAKLIFRRKIRDVYNNLPKWLKARVPALKNEAGELLLANGSGYNVGTSLRSGTYQFVHVSEYGWLCAKFPEKANEIKTGVFPTVHEKGFLSVESTPHGRIGHFYQLCTAADTAEKAERKLSPLEFKRFFFPWWMHPGNVTDPSTVRIDEQHRAYFEQVEQEIGRKLSPEQRAWYVVVHKQLGDDMMREHASTAEEAFRASIEGTIYGNEIRVMRAQGRIRRVPHDPAYEVHTGWDIGGTTAIWFAQFAPFEPRLIDYYQDFGRSFDHQWHVLEERRQRLGYKYGRHFGPHDLQGTETSSGEKLVKLAKDAGIKFTVLDRDERVVHGIGLVRRFLQICWMDEDNCSDGLTAVEAYHYDYSAKHDCFSDTPAKDGNDHPADGLRTLAKGWQKYGSGSGMTAEEDRDLWDKYRRR